jgi:hypothetical protein
MHGRIRVGSRPLRRACAAERLMLDAQEGRRP